MFSDADPEHPGFVPTVVTCVKCSRTLTALVPRFLQDLLVEDWVCPQCKKIEDRNKRVDDAELRILRGVIPDSVVDRIYQDLHSLFTTTC